MHEFCAAFFFSSVFNFQYLLIFFFRNSYIKDFVFKRMIQSQDIEKNKCYIILLNIIEKILKKGVLD